MEQKWDDFLKKQISLLSGYIRAAFPGDGEKHILDVVPDRRQISKFSLIAWISVMGREGTETESS